ncbi:MAG: hypothetical protein ABGX33_07895 [Cycloclasticus sp.]
MKQAIVFLAVSLLVLTACSNDGSATSEADKKTVFDSQLNALDKTRNIENVLQQSAIQRKKELNSE